MTRPLVIVESPYGRRTDGSPASPPEVEANVRYARGCMADCLKRGEYPFASHLLYTQAGILDDTKPEERRLGMDAGFAWGEKADKVVVYTDRGVTYGMAQGINRAGDANQPVEWRTLPGWLAVLS